MAGLGIQSVLVGQEIESVSANQPVVRLPPGVVGGSYRISAPLIRQSRLTSRRNGGVGKRLSDGWCLNFAVGCSHGCPFCYVDEIHKRFGRTRYGAAVLQRWGDYLLTPENLDEAIEDTPWTKWAGEEVMMSSTHDPYLPKLVRAARDILEHALRAGVRFCIQTRSFLVTRDLDLLAEYANQVRLQVSIATMSRDLARLIEPRVPSPEARLEILRRARNAGLTVGVILAPIFPPTQIRPNVAGDIRAMAQALEDLQPDYLYGESLHLRGQNFRLLEEALGEPVKVTQGFDKEISRTFHHELGRVGLRGVWWPEYPQQSTPRVPSICCATRSKTPPCSRSIRSRSSRNVRNHGEPVYVFRTAGTK